jgi:hypothetical protein
MKEERERDEEREKEIHHGKRNRNDGGNDSTTRISTLIYIHLYSRQRIN